MDLPLKLEVLLLLCFSTLLFGRVQIDASVKEPESSAAGSQASPRVCPQQPQPSPSPIAISLYENQLESLGPGVFGPMALQELWLYDNKLSHVEDDTFRNLTQLRLLVLSRNQISSVSTRAFGGLEQLGEVSLHTNLLTTLQAGTFQDLPSLVNISLEHNLISSLPLGFLQGNWLKQHPSKANQTLVVCEAPLNLNGEVIALLEDENFLSFGSTEAPVLTSTEKRRKPQTPPARLSTSSPVVKTTAASESGSEEVTSGGQGEKDTVSNDNSIILIVIAVVATVIISTVIIGFVCWRKNKRGRGNIGRRNKNSVL
ncbi:Leucine-rich repeat-containing protein 15 [Dissostichus eleginoides]|uniref:Leucine-rich repeat-containing protein 15 n=1 Tax=Dissostichus eleginoides TaxID=100907 RepID=A0AAD9C8K8_DISEL|nr:Leucine-rich repeat-containing protein 15 [Dissostichus eleginoides]